MPKPSSRDLRAAGPQSMLEDWTTSGTRSFVIFCAGREIGARGKRGKPERPRYRRKTMTKPGLGIGDWGPGPVRRGQGQPFEPGQGRSRNRYSRLPIGRDESGWWMGNMRRRRRIRFVHEKWIRIAALGR